MRSLVWAGLVCATGLSGCGSSKTCGASPAAQEGLGVGVPEESGPQEWTVNSMTAHRNDQCAGSDNLTIDAPGIVTFCVPDAGKLEAGVDLGTATVLAFNDPFKICSMTLDPARPPTGRLTASGLCDDGTDPAGFALVVEANVPVIRKCGAGQRTAYVAATLSGIVVVKPL